MFAADPDFRLRCFAGLQVKVLDQPHGVHRMHQRNLPVLLQAQSHRTREPIVRVQHVVPGPVPLAELPQRSLQCGQPMRHLLLGHDVGRCAVQVDHANAGAGMLHRFLAVMLGAGENVDGGTQGRLFPRQRADVDVHAAGIASAGPGQRRRMQRQHGDAVRADHAPPPCRVPGRYISSRGKPTRRPFCLAATVAVRTRGSRSMTSQCMVKRFATASWAPGMWVSAPNTWLRAASIAGGSGRPNAMFRCACQVAVPQPGAGPPELP